MKKRGELFVAHDPARAEALWNEKQEIWWSGPDDPNLRMVRVELEEAAMWDVPASSAIAAFEFAKAHRRKVQSRREPEGLRRAGLAAAAPD